MPNIFADIYNEVPGIAGLHYIALGVGLTTASQLNARLLDRIYVHYKKKNGGVGEPEYRLRELLSSPFPDAVLIPNFPSDNDPCKYYPTRWADTFRMGGTRPLALDSNGHRALNLTVFKFRDSGLNVFGLFRE
jgi:hypothetical protein